MQMSGSAKNLASAMLKVQQSAPAFLKTAKGYGYDYTPIDDIINGMRPLLTANGLVLMQSVGAGDDTHIVLTTTIIHADSGEWLQDTATIPAPAVGKANAAQQAGAAITYLRRYSLSALFFLASEGDTDAQQPAPTPAPVKTRPLSPAPATNGTAADGKTHAGHPVTGKTRRQLHVVGAQLYGDEWDSKRADMSAAFEVASSNEWTEEQARKVINGMQERLQAKVEAANAELFPQ